MEFIFITNNVQHARTAIQAGVDRIMVDLEILGKIQRQGHLDTRISNHMVNDIHSMRFNIPTCNLTARVNPLNKCSKSEINSCIEAGADTLMLPMFTTDSEVEEFVSLVSGRARVCLLLETSQAFVRADSIFECAGIDEVHIGLNDLHIGMGLSFMFELLAGGVVESLTSRLQSRGIKFGFGGVARLSSGPLSARLILSEHLRLGSSQVLLSRDFTNLLSGPLPLRDVEFTREIEALRFYLTDLDLTSPELLEKNRLELKRIVHDIASMKRMR